MVTEGLIKVTYKVVFKTVVSLTAGERIIFGVHVYAGGSQTDWQWAKEGTYFGGVYLGD